MSHHSASTSASGRAVRALMQEFQSIQKEPVEGFKVKLLREDNLFDWEVAIFGPPGTLYEGGYFKAHMKFPQDYPYSPPSIRFLSKIWHPNVYENGDLCISILHPPGDDPHSGELPSERWNPTQNVRTILMSVISLLNEPNTSSPANVDASVMFRRYRDSQGRDNEYEQIVKNQVMQTRAEAERDGVKVPTTVEDYCVKTVFVEHKTPAPEMLMDTSDFYYSDDSDQDEDNYEYPDSDNDDVDMQGTSTQTHHKKGSVSRTESAAGKSSVAPNRD
ncbi:ubiquitin-conjugating enzyme E2 R2-like [Paramacrobiotus metropolitanus]|uniref:ubiquitin-conjugating enzyme E2 R2-like n=1 Tax=Paramacrobiotus metropolitanus TaxID=2943436 RepID=UPI002445CAA1|nr:ubiquitin-conjugating enzyme E2 R2-like [Paramacrobiotus metropolitanus]